MSEKERIEKLEAELEEAKEALWQCVDDFKDGLSVCRATWWQARDFFEKYPDGDYPIDPTAQERLHDV